MTLLPFSPAGALLDFVAPGLGFFPVLAVMVVGYAALVLAVRRVYVARNGRLL